MSFLAKINAPIWHSDTGLPYSTRSPARLHGDIANQIGKSIVARRFEPGDRLPGEIAFSEWAKVSRTAYREALRMLAAKGLVESRPKAGTRVAKHERWNFLDPDVVRWFFEDGEPQEYYLKGLFELRLIVEPGAAALAAERRSQADLTELSEALCRMREQTLEFAAGREADRRFHAGILKATGNEVLMSLASGVAAAVNWTTHYKFTMKRLPRDPIVEHEHVFDAIAAADPEAARLAMRFLVEQALQDIRNAASD